MTKDWKTSADCLRTVDKVGMHGGEALGTVPGADPERHPGKQIG